VAVARRRERLEDLQRTMLGPEVGAAAVDFLPVVCDVTKEAEVQVRGRVDGEACVFLRGVSFDSCCGRCL
jgi:hypothetical protein